MIVMYGKFHFLYMMFLKCTENPFFYTVQMAIRADLNESGKSL